MENLYLITLSVNFPLRENYAAWIQAIQALCESSLKHYGILFKRHLFHLFFWIESILSFSPAYLLADSGYDVWMPNFRGNTYSRGHRKLSDKDPLFWQFRWAFPQISQIRAKMNRNGNFIVHDNFEDGIKLKNYEFSIKIFSANIFKIWNN